MLTRKKKSDLESEAFQEKWRYQYFFGEANGKPVCLICKQQVQFAQEYIVQRHYDANHAVKFNKYIGKVRKEKAALLNCSLRNQLLLVKSAHGVNDAAIKAGYMIAYTTVVSQLVRPLSDCAFIKECMLTAAGEICPDKRQDFADIDTSINTIGRRIRDLSKTLNGQLKDKVKDFIAFSVSIDEYAIGNEVSHLAIFIRGVDKNMEVTEEFVELISVKGRTTDEICEKLMEAVDKLGVDWTRAISLARNSGPSLISTGVATKFKEKLLALNAGNCFYDIHSVWHPEVLFTEVLKMNNVIIGIVKVYEAIKTGRGIMFAKRHPMDKYGVFKGNILKRFHAMCDELNTFFKERKCVPELEDAEWLQDLAFTVDVKEHLNNLQAKLMGHNKLVIDSYDSMCAYEVKLELLEKQLLENDLTHFPTLKSRRAIDSFPCGAHNEKCSNKILELKKEFQSRLNSFKNLRKLFKIFWNPFSFGPYEAPEDLQLELIELQCDLVLKNKFSSVDTGTFYKYLEPSYPNLTSLAAKILSMFGSMSVCKKLFQFLNSNSSRYFFRQSEKLWKSGLKIATAQTLSPDFDLLVQIWKQRQAEALTRNDKAGVSRAGADVASSSVTDPVWSGQENALGSSQEMIEKQYSRSKEIRTEPSSSDEYLDCNESKVYIDVAEHPEDSRKRKHSMGDWEEFPSVSDGRKYIKSEDDIDEKIDISKECIFVEPYEEQNTLRDRSQVTDASLTNIKQEPDSDDIVWIREMS